MDFYEKGDGCCYTPLRRRGVKGGILVYPCPSVLSPQISQQLYAAATSYLVWSMIMMSCNVGLSFVPVAHVLPVYGCQLHFAYICNVEIFHHRILSNCKQQLLHYLPALQKGRYCNAVRPYVRPSVCSVPRNLRNYKR